MSKRIRYTWLIIIGIVGGFLAVGAWHQSPGQDPDNQGGYVLVFLFFIVLLCVYVSTAMRAIGARFRKSKSAEGQGSELRPSQRKTGTTLD